MKKILSLLVCGLGSIAPIYATNSTSASVEYFQNSESVRTKTPIKHLIVIYQENVTFDRYFATYPNALNPEGEPKFVAKPNTPKVNGLTNDLIKNNPNKHKPYRLERDKWICTSNHDYFPIIAAVNNGKMDNFLATENPKCPGENMAYYDGNTVTALWNYAQQYAMSDNTYSTIFGPTLPGHLNLVAGTTGHAVSNKPAPNDILNGYMIGNLSSGIDDCSYTEDDTINSMNDGNNTSAEIIDQKNIGDSLNDVNVKWGWFSAGFRPTGVTKYGKSICGDYHTSRFGVTTIDYDSTTHPFMYYKSTTNQHHLPPTSIQAIGSQDQANHQYDMRDFYDAINSEDAPSVMFLKSPEYQQGHGDYSDPLDEQEYLVNTINKIMKSKIWKDSAIIVTYDDTDGSYDHVMPPKSHFDSVEGRRGFGQRIPFVVISPFSKENYVDHKQLNQAYILKFIEYNWSAPEIGGTSIDKYSHNFLEMFDFSKKYQNTTLILDPKTGLK